MAYSTTTTNAPTSSLLGRIGSGFDALATRYKQYRMYRETFDGLSALSNRDLADLGLSRSDIKRIAIESSRI
ncbi:hypothetical protein BOO69_06120 [Sulfitobacter alexandrii]|uniref:YjiS-like domain-containing protein n=1 Tax=Sulfitobacter alexandrii TaxID=1917485 RepID=A0A1J0WFE2_9RHOB|nr:DUF1127 domain-containing protein [Sulfitobacter alexandrii]APE43039.1 hypothetical protein BOO69_06120 [Sulfitobacter alexandrii]